MLHRKVLILIAAERSKMHPKWQKVFFECLMDTQLLTEDVRKDFSAVVPDNFDMLRCDSGANITEKSHCPERLRMKCLSLPLTPPSVSYASFPYSFSKRTRDLE